VIHTLEEKFLKWLRIKFVLHWSDLEEKKMLRWLKKGKAKSEEIGINTEFQMIVSWLWKITEYNIEEVKSRKLMNYLQSNLQTLWKCLMDRRSDFENIREVIDSITNYIISGKEQKE
jgi:DNA integrity scanning protein DisA with diadenylate cyclase activity